MKHHYHDVAVAHAFEFRWLKDYDVLMLFLEITDCCDFQDFPGA